MTRLLALLTLFFWTSAFANDRDTDPSAQAEDSQEEEEVVESDAISFVDVMPAISRLTKGLELDRHAAPALEREARIRLSLFTTHPLDTPTDSADQVVELFLIISMLRELHRRGLLGRDLRPIEVQAAFHLHQIGQQAQSDPLFDRRLKRWLADEQDRERAALLRQIRISLQAATEVAGRWFPEAIMAAQREAQQDERMSIYIGLWLIDAGNARRGVEVLDSVYSFGQIPIRAEAYYRGLRLAGHDEKAEALLKDLAEPAPHYLRAFQSFDRRLAERKAEVSFRISARPRPIDAWMDHIDRRVRDPSTTSQELRDAVALMLEDQPEHPEAWRLAVGFRLSEFDIEGMEDLIAQAEAAGIPEEHLVDLRLAKTVSTAVLPDYDASRLEAELGAFEAQVGREGRSTVEGVALYVEVMRHLQGHEGAREARWLTRRARRHARRHRSEPEAIRLAAAALTMLDEIVPATKVLRRRARRLPQGDKGRLYLEGARLWSMAYQIDGAPQGLERSEELLSLALEGGAPPPLVMVERVANDQIASSPTVDPASVHPLLRGWFDELDRADRRLGSDPEGERARLAIALGLSQVAVLLDRGEGIAQPLNVARSIASEHPLTRLVLGQYLMVAGEPQRANEVFSAIEPELSFPSEQWSLARWQLLACAQVGDLSCVQAQRDRLAELWDEARIPSQREAIWAHIVYAGGVNITLKIPRDAPLQIRAELDPRPVLLAHPPHDRQELLPAGPAP
ncbi:MAG: hypothetical protein EA397_11855 [Deltaproteobacteria bacterium]|nr:MAG: hypothetical protein EA397_11855 [Deltaproteobacteria bacterium]